ncbi:MAG: tyrosine-protein phosphatase [Clostridia bacterium]|nr:tyrosine-protein phosphatase [Clostridia bacterium]
MSRVIRFETLNNTRDLGGISARDGRHIKKGRLIRSGQLSGISANDKKKLGSLVSTVVDFRYDRELEKDRYPEIEGVEYLRVPVFEEKIEGVTRDDEPEDFSVEHFMDDGVYASRYMCGIYRCFIDTENCRSSYRRFIDILLKEHDRAVLWNCSAGKDRTGFATVLVQEILGVRRDRIIADYLRTNYYIRHDVERIIDHVRRSNPGFTENNREALENIITARPEYIRQVYEEAERKYGSFEGFVRNGLGMSEDEIKLMRDMYLE